MRVLIVSASFYPKNSPRSFRTTELVKEFCRRKVNVDLYIPLIQPVHKEFEEKYQCLQIHDLGRPKWNSMQANKKGRLFRLLSRGYNRLFFTLFDLPQSQFYGLTRRRLKTLERKYDLLISIAVPHSIHWGIASFWNKNKLAKIWVADCGDPFAYNINDSFNKPFYFRFLENDFLAKCDFISVPFSDLIRFFNPYYKNKFRVIPQGFNFSDQKLAAQINNEKEVLIAFSGSVLKGIRDPYILLDHLLKYYPGKFKFFIFTKQKALFRQYEGKKEIVLKEYIPRKELIYFLSTMDFLVNIDTDSYDSIVNAIPSKLIDYCLSKRPIYRYEHSKLDTSQLSYFMDADYSSYKPPLDIDEYKINRVVDKFIELSQESK